MTHMNRTDDVPDTFGERLHKIRRRRGMDGRTLAAAMGVTQASISQWERDKARPSLERIERLAEVLQADLLWLAFGQVRVPGPEEGDGSSTKWYAGWVSPDQQAFPMAA